jgi:hypothetical protein
MCGAAAGLAVFTKIEMEARPELGGVLLKCKCGGRRECVGKPEASQ